MMLAKRASRGSCSKECVTANKFKLEIEESMPKIWHFCSLPGRRLVDDPCGIDPVLDPGLDR
jgi:hypothetical protein